MDDARFDALTRRHLGLADRRDVLRGLAVALGGGTTALAALAAAADRKKRKKRKKRKRRDQDDDPEPPPACLNSQVRCGEECVRGVCCPGAFCGGTCRCLTSTDGDTFCAKNVIVQCVACPVDGCSAGRRCVPSGCGAGAICVPECGT